jgi:hypothetical protein
VYCAEVQNTPKGPVKPILSVKKLPSQVLQFYILYSGSESEKHQLVAFAAESGTWEPCLPAADLQWLSRVLQICSDSPAQQSSRSTPLVVHFWASTLPPCPWIIRHLSHSYPATCMCKRRRERFYKTTARRERERETGAWWRVCRVRETLTLKAVAATGGGLGTCWQL